MFSPTPSPISRTVTYRKITKPLLERKRRARINRCLDELKDLMFTALEAEGENVDKLEKADILEFTVKHLQKITKRDPAEEAYKFQEGFSHCASEACSFLLSLPGLDSVVGRRLVEYLAKSVSRALESQVPPSVAAAIPNCAVPAAATVADRSNAVVTAEAVARGHTPPPSSDPPLPPPPPPPSSGDPPPPIVPSGEQRPQRPPSPCHVRTACTGLMPPKPVALSASNRAGPPHTVIRPKPTRPVLGRSSSLTPPQHHHDDVAAAAAAAKRDPMWRPW